MIARLNAAGTPHADPTFLGAHEVPEEHRGNREAYVRLVVNDVLPRVSAAKLAEYCDVFCEPSVFTVDQAERVLRAARELGLGLRMHAEQLMPSGGARIAAKLHARTADHLEWVNHDDIAALRDASPR